MKVLVTGPQGFVGAAVRAALAAHDHTVLTLGDDVPGELFDEPSLRSAMRGVDGVVHLAGVDHPRTPLRDAERVNLIAAENVLAAARAAGVRRLVHRSHECVTRTDQHRSYADEKLPHAPRFADPTTETLCLAEDLVLAASGGAIETVSLRPGVLWGVGDDAFLPALLRRVRDGRLTWIDGGAALMATTWIESFALAACLALTAAEAPGAAFYVTDDERVTRREFLGNLLRACGVKVPTRSIPWLVARAGAALGARPLGEVLAEGRSANFNIQRARTALGYAPAVTVAEGTRRVGAWVAAQGGWEVVAGKA